MVHTLRRISLILKRYYAQALFLCIIALSVLAVWYVPGDIRSVIGEHPVSGAIVFALLMCGATVIAPLTLLPTVPLVATELGPWVTGFACWIGWTLGSVIAFLIARHGGRPLLHHFVREERIRQYESRLPKEIHFGVILALRLIVPVDILSYALGLFSSVSLTVYTLASLLGICWFSFAFSFLGYGVFHSATVLFITFSVVSSIIFLGAFTYIRRALKR